MYSVGNEAARASTQGSATPTDPPSSHPASERWLLEHQRDEDAMALNKLLEGVVRASRALLDEADFQLGLQRWLGFLADAVDADAAILGSLEPPSQDTRAVARWGTYLSRRGLASVARAVPPTTDFIAWAQRLQAGESVWAHLEDLPASAPAAPEPVSNVPAPAIDAPTSTETVKGRKLTVVFEGRRCIHSRHCVLEAPTVFKANTPGAWIDPDAVPAALLVAVAQRCPSCAIRYQTHDGQADEQAPPVNTLHVRENGPYAIHAPLTVEGQPDGWRATLCRCGQSANKPWCDGSHGKAGFVASGEPPKGAADALPARDGPLAVTPLRDGPLRVQGNLEVCAGTGRTVARTTDTRLCRCGHSKNKPFCDLSHVAADFSAAGA